MRIHRIPHTETINLTVPGWVASPEKIVAACEKITGLLKSNPQGESPLFVMDLFGNSTFRYEQFDSSFSLPFKSGGKYHLEGNIVLSTPQQFKKISEQIVPILLAKKDAPCVLVPPLPRYLFSPCCDAKNHCPNQSDPEFPHKILSELVILRNVLIKVVNECGVNNTRVVDSCPVTKCRNTDNIAVRLSNLRDVACGDGVHYTKAGLHNLASTCIQSLNSISDRVDNSVTPSRDKTFYWRGFKSHKGASKMGAAVARAALLNNQPQAGLQTGPARKTGAGHGGQGGHGSRGGRGSTNRSYHPYRR